MNEVKVFRPDKNGVLEEIEKIHVPKKYLDSGEPEVIEISNHGVKQLKKSARLDYKRKPGDACNASGVWQKAGKKKGY